METKRARSSRIGRLCVALGAACLLSLSGCGGPQRPPGAAAPEAVVGEANGGYEDLLAALGRAKIALCDPAEGGRYTPLPAPAAERAATASYFRYLEGRIYEFGPCDAPAGRRNELRIFRYPEAIIRDAAIREMAGRNNRPTSVFAVGDTYEAQIWSPNPSLEGPVGQAAATVHFAISRVEQSRHLNAAPALPSSSSTCPTMGTRAPTVLDIAGFAYCPVTLTVAAGAEVTWINTDLTPHTVTYEGAGGPVDSGSMAQGQSWSARFGEAGTFRYYCRFHPGMEGRILVT